MTTRILIAFATREGHTRKIAEHVSAALRALGFEVDTVDIGEGAPLAVGRYGAAVLAASVHLGKHEREMTAFVTANRDTLALIPTAFLSVSLSEAGAEDPRRTPEQRARAEADVRRVIDAFLAETEFHPACVQPIAGALPYRQYGALLRIVMRLISKRSGGPTDTSRDYDLTDWSALDRFVDEIATHLPAPH